MYQAIIDLQSNGMDASLLIDLSREMPPSADKNQATQLLLFSSTKARNRDFLCCCGSLVNQVPPNIRRGEYIQIRLPHQSSQQLAVFEVNGNYFLTLKMTIDRPPLTPKRYMPLFAKYGPKVLQNMFRDDRKGQLLALPVAPPHSMSADRPIAVRTTHFNQAILMRSARSQKRRKADLFAQNMQAAKKAKHTH